MYVSFPQIYMHVCVDCNSQVYVIDIMGQGQPRELTSGKQGATHSPVFNKQCDKVAWLELDKDGYESDRAKIVIYDMTKDIRYTLTQHWDRSPDSLAVCPSLVPFLLP
jgi:hypothetical protein